MNKKLLSILFLLVFKFSGFSQETITYQDAFPNLTFQYPVEILNASDDSNRMFVVEQQGVIKVFSTIENSDKAEIFLDIQDVVSFSSGQEIGLLGLAFHPNFKANKTFYIYHTKQSTVAGVGVEIVLAKYTVDPLNENKADINSRVEIFSFDKNQNTSNHNGGKIAFGPDGYLYISVGDGGGGGDPNGNAQNLENVFGSILRIDVDLDNNNPLENNPDLPNGNYEIPSDNPRVGISGLDELYAWGIRNTWKFSFENETLWGADVGQDQGEEINHIIKGGNYGWNRFEGNNSYNSSTVLATRPDIKPIFEYDHTNGDRSITGGYVYNGESTNTLIKGKYIYADYVTGRVWALDYNEELNSTTNNLLFRTNGDYVSSFGLDESGEMYFSGYGTNAKIYKIYGGEEPVINEPGKIDGIGYWNVFAESTDGVINCIVENGDDIYIGGLFTKVGAISTNNLAVYNKQTGWKKTIGGPNGEVKSIAISPNNEVVIGGSFSTVNGIIANNIALWDGVSWSALGVGTEGPVAKIAIDADSKIYAGGAFVKAGNIVVNNIAVWDNAWAAIKEATSVLPGLNNEVREIVISDNGVVYIGGNFDAAGEKSAARIATWNGENWGTLGIGTSGFVESIALNSNYVYAGGNFNLASNETVNRIARWNLITNKWEKLGNGLSGSVKSIAIHGNEIYAAGSFVFASNEQSKTIIVNNIAQFTDVNGWQPLGEELQIGTNGLVNTIQYSETDNSLYVGGNFTKVGDVNSNFLGSWSKSFVCTDDSVIQEYQIDGVWSSGENIIEVNEGSDLVLSILPNTKKFKIILPNGEEVEGDLDLPNISETSAGVYIFETEEGCSATLDITVIPKVECNIDLLITEYRKNEVAWIPIINNELIVAEGNLIDLRLVGTDDEYTITKPDGILVQGELTLPSFSSNDTGTYIFETKSGCIKSIVLKGCDSVSVNPEFKIADGEWVADETKTVVDEGVSFSIGMPNSISTYTVTTPNGELNNGIFYIEEITKQDEGDYIITENSGCSSIFSLEVIAIIPEECPNALLNENPLLDLFKGINYGDNLLVESNNLDVNNSPCSLLISTLADNRPWEKYMISMNLEELGIIPGDTLNVSLDGKNIDGNARIEVVQNNKPNTWLLGHTFTNEWTTYSQQIIVPEDIVTLDIWLFSNYSFNERGTVMYDNLIVEKLKKDDEPISDCANSISNISEEIVLENFRMESGLDNLKGLDSGDEEYGCVLEITNSDQNQPWARHSISVNIENNNLKPGNILSISIDAKTVNGNARIEVVQDNKPNTWLMGNTFSNEWTTYARQIIVPENITTLDIWLFSNYEKNEGGTSLFGNLIVEKIGEVEEPIEGCEDSLVNSNDEIALANERLQAGLDKVEGVDSLVSEIGCAFQIANEDQNQPWARYSMTINILENNLQVGDELLFSIDGKTLEGGARIEVAENDKPNAWQLGHNFSNEWSNYSQSITIRPNTETLDIWLFSNYGVSSGEGIAQFANLSVQKMENNILTPLRINLSNVDVETSNIPVSIYPNPTADNVYLDVSTFSGQELTLNLISPNSVLLVSDYYKKNHANILELNLSSYPPGVYLISITSENGSVSVKKVVRT